MQTVFAISTVIFGALSAFCWSRSARVKIPTGWDTSVQQSEAFSKAARYNAGGAGFAAAAVGIQALQSLLTIFHLVG
ncbi:hypothetical protein [Burkholderia sp. AU16741]|uniref:hypothetical protein n=1 Tax=Burkholderia sp. AU16741 TaxID=2015347 RepID=UPI0011802F23|nr:hypothetical protein [Burkholderia sp. AU16741]